MGDRKGNVELEVVFVIETVYWLEYEDPVIAAEENHCRTNVRYFVSEKTMMSALKRDGIQGSLDIKIHLGTVNQAHDRVFDTYILYRTKRFQLVP